MNVTDHEISLMALEVDLFVRLDDDKSISFELHLDRFATAATEERLERDVGLEVR